MEPTYRVVVNDEQQYSIWSTGSEIPDGWREEGARGTEQHCLEHIERIWTDLRPRSAR